MTTKGDINEVWMRQKSEDRAVVMYRPLTAYDDWGPFKEAELKSQSSALNLQKMILYHHFCIC